MSMWTNPFNDPSRYKGWAITDRGDSVPVTGRWGARRFGVTLCAGDEDALLRMINYREENDV